MKGKSIVDKGEKRERIKVLKERWPCCNDKEKMLLCHEGWVGNILSNNITV